MTKQTPLYAWHVEQGAKMVPFAGWMMPLSYTSQIEEHHRVRRSVGIFDVSHMGELLIQGKGSAEFCDWLLPNKIRTLERGQTSYNPLCREDGTVVDDVYVYFVSATQIFICVNASNVEKDFEFVQDQARRRKFSGKVHNLSEHYAQVAVQGPAATALVQAAYPEWQLEQVKRFRFMFPQEDGSWVVSKTGYTGESGVEIYLPPGDAVSVVTRLLETAKKKDIECSPAGLGCRDTLRLEAGFPLYGHELDDAHTAVESGLARFCQFGKGEFCGREILQDQVIHREKCREQLIAFKSESRRAPRQGQVLIDGQGVSWGKVVSGAFSPTLSVGIGMGFVRAQGQRPPERLIARSDQGELGLHVTTPPFYTATN